MDTKKNRNNMISLLAVYFAANVIFITTPVLNLWATEVYTGVPYSTVLFLSTISSLLMIPGSLIAGAVLGKKVRYKTMAVISMGGIIIAGCLPYFIRNFAFAIVMRAIVGFCIGLGFPLQSTLALKLFDDAQRPGVLGKATISMSVGAIVYMLLSGYVADFHAADSFLVHAILIIPLVLVLIFLEEPEPEKETAVVENKQKEKLPGMALFASAMFMFIFFAFYPVLLNMSAIIDYEGIGSASISAVISCLYTIGNAIAGFIFAALYKKTGKYTIPVGVALWALGAGVFAFGNGIVAIILGVILCGIAAQIVWPATVNSFSEYVPAGKQSMATAIFISGMNVGCFLTTYFISAVAAITGNENPRIPCQIGVVIIVIFAVIWSVVEMKREHKNVTTE